MKKQFVTYRKERKCDGCGKMSKGTMLGHYDPEGILVYANFCDKCSIDMLIGLLSVCCDEDYYIFSRVAFNKHRAKK